MEISIKIIGDKEIRLKPNIFRNEKGKVITISFYDEFGIKEYLKLELNDSQYKIVEKNSDIIESDDDLNSMIEEWLVDENPNNQFGTEQNEIEENDDTPYDPAQIRVDTKQFSLHQIYELINRGDIDLTPDFQRNLVWDSKQKSRLIESILMRIPLPMFYFAQDEEARISVVDGLQRLSTIKEFMSNKLILKNLEYLDEKCGGRIYTSDSKDKAIDAKYFRWFNMTQITVNVIDPSSPYKLKYEIFKRLNTGGKPLNSQEVRNCLSSDSLRKALREMSHLQSFRNATGGSIKDVRMESQELALRFVLFHRKYTADKLLNNYSGNIESELNSLTEFLSKEKNFDFKFYIDLFNNAMLNSDYLFGKYSFRKCTIQHLKPGAYRQLINKALFVSWSVLLSHYDHKDIKNNNKENVLAMPMAEKVTNDTSLYNYLSYSTNSKVNIQAAFKSAEEVLVENLKN